MEDSARRLQDVINSPEYKRAEMHRRLQEFEAAVEMAAIRCLTRQELLQRLRDSLGGPDDGPLLYQLERCDLSSDDLSSVAEIAMSLVNIQGLPSRARQRIDSRLKRLLRVLPREFSNPIVWQLLESRHKSRRDIGYRVLCRTGLTATQAENLVNRFREIPDQGALELVVRSPDVLQRADTAYILESLDDEYWRARAIEVLLGSDMEVAIHLGSKYPFEMAHAIGRSRNPLFVEFLRDLAAKHRENLEFASICAWAFGHLGASNELSSLTNAVHKRYVTSTVQQAQDQELDTRVEL
jgi:hypothetical protein